jgi:hypothetical protein
MQEMEDAAPPQQPGIWTLISGHRPISTLPGANQSPTSIAAWTAANARIGTVVVVRHAQRGLVEFHLDEIAQVNAELCRLTLAHHGNFLFNGSGTAGPKGAMTLLAPAADVNAAAMSGQAWINGRPAYRRAMPATERALVARLMEPNPEVAVA